MYLRVMASKSGRVVRCCQQRPGTDVMQDFAISSTTSEKRRHGLPWLAVAAAMLP
jgi:hypothetical protein